MLPEQVVDPTQPTGIVTDMENLTEDCDTPSVNLTMNLTAIERYEDKLEAFVRLVELEKTIKAAKAELMLEANASFQAHYKAGDGEVAILDHKISKVSPKTEYTFSATIIQAEKDVKASKEAAKIDGSAVGVPSAQDPNTTQLFKVL